MMIFLSIYQLAFKDGCIITEFKSNNLLNGIHDTALTKSSLQNMGGLWAQVERISQHLPSDINKNQ